MLRQLAALALGIVLVALWGARDVCAHAVLLTANPSDGEVLAAPPPMVALSFNEPVTPVYVRVLDASGTAIETPHPLRVVDTELRLSMPTDVKNGSYIVSYRVASADSHPVGGAIAFSIGTAVPTVVHQAAEDEGWMAAKAALYFLQHLALFVATGAALFQAFVLRGATLKGIRLLIGMGVAAALVLSILQIGVEGALLAAARSATGLLDPAAWQLGLRTSLATSTGFVIPSLVLVGLGLWSRAKFRWWSVAGAIAAPACLALTGHAAGSGSIAQAFQALHALTASFWIGSLVPLAIVLYRRPIGEAPQVTRRFSNIAVPTVFALLLSGIVVLFIRVPSPMLLIHSDYGKLLFIKLGFVAVLLLLAAANRFRLTPIMAQAARAHAALQTSIRVGLILIVGVLLVTALIAHTRPPHDNEIHEYRRSEGGYSVVTKSGNRSLLLVVTPAGTGTNSIDLRFTAADNTPLPLQEVTVAFARPEIGVEGLTRRADPMGTGQFRLSNVPLSPAGSWQLRIEALIGEFEQTVFTTSIALQ